MAVRGYVLAKTGWTLEYINSLTEMHLLFAYHHIKAEEDATWDRLSAHLGTVWDRDALAAVQSVSSSGSSRSSKVFVPLSLVINPELPDAILGKKRDPTRGTNHHSENQSGDGLYTDVALPAGEEVINMGTLPKKDFFDRIASVGLKTST